MEETKDMKAYVIEKDTGARDAILKILKQRGYKYNCFSTVGEALKNFTKGAYLIAILGETEDHESPFDGMKQVVSESPMTSLILLTDESKEKVDELAEGYGILGHVKREIPSDEISPLLAQFESICKLLAPPAC